MIGLQPYLYKEGFTYHLIPFTPDTANKGQKDNVNPMVMYDNMINKFKWGNFNTAKYLDHESTTMSYPNLLTNFLDLTQSLIAVNRPDLALKTLQKCDQELPDLNPFIDVNFSKLYLAESAYKLKNIVLGNKFANNIDDYLTDQLDYNYYLLQNNSDQVNLRDVTLGVRILGTLAYFVKDAHQEALTNKLNAQYKDYAAKFASVLNAQQ